jgi:EAL domain-containing protein (putative c-di-GMP-specific phosphodiesterase class I)
VEALLRWRHPTRGVVGPTEFVPTLEETGMIGPVGRWVLDEACRQAVLWRDQGVPIGVSVNVSVRQLEADEFVHQVREVLSTTGIDPGLLTLEVTESTLMRDAEGVIDRLRSLKTLGLRVAIDDFGTGYSSLAYLQRFPVDTLKIDRSFVAAMNDSPESLGFIRTLVELGQVLGVATLAEGIETGGHFDMLRDVRCQQGQGFWFSEPVDAASIASLLSGLGIGDAERPVAPGHLMPRTGG